MPPWRAAVVGGVWLKCLLAVEGEACSDRALTPAGPHAVHKQLLRVCTSGGEFLRKFARLSGGEGGERQWKCAFCLTRDGRVVKVQRTIFSECFYVLALDELSRVTGDKDMQVDRPFGNTVSPGRGRG